MFRKSSALGLKPVAREVCAIAVRVSRRVGVMAAVLALTSLAAAQNADTRSIDAYLKAITQPPGSSRVAALERFASATSSSNLKLDALEWAVWEERQTHNDAAADTWARHLLDVDPENALGLAITVDSQRRSSLSPATYYATAQLGLQNLPRLRRPEGMSHDDFNQMQQLVEAILNAAAGQAELEQKNYAAARISLARAVMASPNDAQLVYALALADLSGDKPNRPQGYWLLAKAVNLSGGAAAARHIEEFGRKKYKQDGGSDREWDQYLSSTASPGANAATMISTTDMGSDSHKRHSESHATKPDAKANASKPASPDMSRENKDGAK